MYSIVADLAHSKYSWLTCALETAAAHQHSTAALLAGSIDLRRATSVPPGAYWIQPDASARIGPGNAFNTPAFTLTAASNGCIRKRHAAAATRSMRVLPVVAGGSCGYRQPPNGSPNRIRQVSAAVAAARSSEGTVPGARAVVSATCSSIYGFTTVSFNTIRASAVGGVGCGPKVHVRGRVPCV